MACKEVQGLSPIVLETGNPFPSINAQPNPESAPKALSYFVCDQANETPLLAKTLPGLSLQKSTILFAPKVTLPKAPPSLPPPPTSPWARLLYDLTTQLQDFELTTTLKMPVDGIRESGPV